MIFSQWFLSAHLLAACSRERGASDGRCWADILPACYQSTHHGDDAEVQQRESHHLQHLSVLSEGKCLLISGWSAAWKCSEFLQVEKYFINWYFDLVISHKIADVRNHYKGLWEKVSRILFWHPVNFPCSECRSGARVLAEPIGSRHWYCRFPCHLGI